MERYAKKIGNHYELDHNVVVEEMKRTNSSLLDVLIKRVGMLEENINTIHRVNVLDDF